MFSIEPETCPNPKLFTFVIFLSFSLFFPLPCLFPSFWGISTLQHTKEAPVTPCQQQPEKQHSCLFLCSCFQQVGKYHHLLFSWVSQRWCVENTSVSREHCCLLYNAYFEKVQWKTLAPCTITTFKPCFLNKSRCPGNQIRQSLNIFWYHFKLQQKLHINTNQLISNWPGITCEELSSWETADWFPFPISKR